MRRLVFLILALAAAAAQAGDGAISVSPSVIMLRGNLGQSTTQRLTIENSTGDLATFVMTAKDVVVRDGRRLFAEAGETPGSIAATAVFSQKTVTVRPGERVSVGVTFTLPPATACRAAVALFQSSRPVMRGNSRVFASLGTLLTFTVSDDALVHAGEVRITPQSATRNASFAQPLVNGGSDPVVARGVVALLDAQGRLVGKSEMAPVRLLPAERNEIRGEYAGELAPGRYRVLLTVDAQGRALTRSAEMEVR